MRRITTFLTTAAAAVVLAGAASAHSPYIAPTTFAPDREFVSVSTAMTEGNFFVPDFPIRGAGDYVAVSPAGEVVDLGAGVTFKELSVVDVPLPQEGTWRIGTGERPGRVAKWARIDGQWRMVRPAGQPAPPPRPPEPARKPGAMSDEAPPRVAPVEAADVPAGTEVIESRSFLKAETYVTRGAPSKGALKPVGKGFELIPETHPNEIYAGEAFKFALTQDGRPAPAHYAVARAGDNYAEKRFSLTGAADAAGKAAITFDQPGVYVLEIHYPERGEGAPPLASSTVYSLTFEVTR